MTPRTRPPAAWVPYLLMSGILAFGIGAATLVLFSGDPAAEPGPVAVARGVQREAPVSPADAEPSAVSAPLVPAPVAAAPAPPSASAGKTAASKPSAAPSAPNAATQPATARAPATPTPRPTPPAAAAAPRSARAAEAEPKPIPVKRRPSPEPAPEPEVAFTKTPPKVEGKVVLKSEEPAPTSRSAPAASPAEVKPAGIDTKPAGEVEPLKPTGKSVHAAPLVAPPPSKPTVVMATGEKAWVKLDDQRTVIVPKGQEVPGLGVFHGTEGRGAKFDSGVQPVTP